jgi:CRISPR-associated endonuclease/helicase Cas3
MVADFAHSVRNLSSASWEPLRQHASAVAEGSARRGAPIGVDVLARAAGLLHDIGKCSALFQGYLQAGDAQSHGPDHSTAGAIEARRLYPGPIGRMLAFVVAGHHAGLADGVSLYERLTKTVPAYAGWEGEIDLLPEPKSFGPILRASSPHRGFLLAFFIRMLFSCLVDADFVETEAFYSQVEQRNVEREGFTPLPVAS